MKLEYILAEYGQRKGIPDLHLTSEGNCVVAVDEKSVVCIEKSLDRKGFYLYSTVAVIPKSSEKEIALIALQGNLFGKETGRSSLGYDERTGSLVLFMYLEEESTDTFIFSQRFLDFLKYLSFWLVKIETIHHEVSESERNHTAKEYERKIFFA